MKITIIGYGLIGKSIADTLKSKHEVVIIDIDRLGDFKNHHDSDGVIVCVYNDDIFSVLSEIPVFLPVLIRSSLSPDTVDKIHNLYQSHSIVISPDFSRTTGSNNDFLNQKYIILGGEDPDCFWQDLFQELLPNCNMIFNCADKEAALIKYATEGFLALKLSFFNQIYDICQSSALDFDIVRQLISHDSRIGNDHTMVPGVDGNQGWNGADLTRDIDEFIKWANSLEYPLTTLETAVKYNTKIRKKH